MLGSNWLPPSHVEPNATGQDREADIFGSAALCAILAISGSRGSNQTTAAMHCKTDVTERTRDLVLEQLFTTLLNPAWPSQVDLLCPGRRLAPGRRQPGTKLRRVTGQPAGTADVKAPSRPSNTSDRHKLRSGVALGNACSSPLPELAMTTRPDVVLCSNRSFD